MAEKPNDTARLQFLAVLEYLLTKTDEKHPSSTNEIINYTEEQYGVSLRREQAKSIVEHIYELCKTRKKVLPYEIMCSSKTKANKKYYVSKKNFDVDTIVKVCSAIGNEKTITKTDSSYLINQLVDDYIVADKRKIAVKKIKQRIRNVKKMDDELSKKTDIIYDLEYTRNIFEFSLNAITSDVFEQSCVNYGPDKITIQPKTRYKGVVIKVEEDTKTKHLFVFIYMQELKAVIKTSVENILDIDDWSIPYRGGETDLLQEEAQLTFTYMASVNTNRGAIERVRSNPYSTVQKAMEKRWGKYSSFCENVTFKFCINTPEEPNTALFNKTKKSFEKFFECPMVYENKERVIIEDEGTEQERRIIALDVYVTVTTDFYSFKKWVIEEASLIDNVVVMTPKLRNWNDRLVGSLIEFYARRLNKYGYRYHYEVTKTLTEQAQKDIEERRKEMAEWRARREERRKASQANQDSES